ncbi:hypothetical protein [Nakamurella endophytica]|uniref:SH3 domain-containing protein n=1 Tax=Nakamurella endophytica TaxID=1748367 RepID=A0A917WDA0_9ACTN|nr:hypothetical protein [Nakamurella endophytica]GGL96412.1 hypothetical protein GCM10011594_15210 [Nakamurella endophytica]
MRTLAAVAAAAFGILAVGTATAAAAADREPTGVVKTTTTSYMLPTDRSTPVHVDLRADTEVYLQCWARGQSLSGNPMWYRIATGGKLGFVPAGTVHSMVPNPPACSMN